MPKERRRRDNARSEIARAISELTNLASAARMMVVEEAGVGAEEMLLPGRSSDDMPDAGEWTSDFVDVGVTSSASVTDFALQKANEVSVSLLLVRTGRATRNGKVRT